MIMNKLNQKKEHSYFCTIIYVFDTALIKITKDTFMTFYESHWNLRKERE